ncbi:serine hydrolase domain-containing protein [Brevibacterium samyangense]|uniref:Serine hydrolase domain-containing protein n=1 Tax=Brevibacterium samyangense TaxID=366888 RepID=A0ABP5ETJ5_9MICO
MNAVSSVTTHPRPASAAPADPSIAEALSALRQHLSAAIAESPAPEVAWGLVKDGRVVDGENLDRIFRIASMTKSFTAATLLGLKYGLVECGAGERHPGTEGSTGAGVTSGGAPSPLDLDLPVSTWIPATAGLPHGEITLRDALTMSSGLPNDDPWADRQESLTAAEFDALAARAAHMNFLPGTAFEYANYGYAMLGRVVEVVSGLPFPEAVRTALLAPLGLDSSDFRATDLPADRLVTGYRPTAAGGLEPLSYSDAGAFSAIGGMFSTVRDLAVWVDRFVRAANPGAGGAAGDVADGPAGGVRAVVDPWARPLRDMQQAHRFVDVRPADPSDADSPNGVRSAGYGYGLNTVFDSALGHFVAHSGGYPGFGSHMRWHPASGYGLVILGNTTYFPASVLADAALSRFIADAEVPTGLEPVGAPARTAPVFSGKATAVQRHRPSSEAMALIPRLEEWIRLGATDDSFADAVFAENMDLDVPRIERRTRITEALAATGETDTVVSAPGTSDAAADVAGQGSPAAGTPIGTSGSGATGGNDAEATRTSAPEVIWVNASRARWTVAGPQAERLVDVLFTAFGEVQSLSVTVKD